MTNEAIELLKWIITLPEPANNKLADEYIRLIAVNADTDEPPEVLAHGAS